MAVLQLSRESRTILANLTMKTAILALLVAGASAFAPAATVCCFAREIWRKSESVCHLFGHSDGGTKVGAVEEIAFSCYSSTIV